jgi:hypothetical protein
MTSSYVSLTKSSRNHLTDFIDTNTDSILKANYIIINSVLDKLNVTKRELFQSTWGYFDVKTKSWSGMMGDLVHHGADIGGTPLFMAGDRVPVIDYMPLSTKTTGNFIFRAPQLSSGNLGNMQTDTFKF